MPVASLKSSSQAAYQDSLETTKTLIGMIDKKVRNLEKRKGKLDSYKQLVADGKELNEDQQAAVENLQSVELNLEFAKDLQKQFNQFFFEHAKAQKKQAKKEEALRIASRRDADTALIKNVLQLQSLLLQLSDEARDDFIAGTNGAVELGEEVVKQIDELYKVATPDEERDDVPIAEQIAAASHHLSEYFNCSSKEFAGTTYKSLADAVARINDSGYFDKKDEEKESDEAAEEEDEGEDEAKEESGEGEADESPVEDVAETAVPEATSNTEASATNGDTEEVSEATKPETNSQEEVTANEHGLNFLGESEVSSRSQIHADAPPFYPSSSQPQQQSSFDKDFAPNEDNAGWGETGSGFESNEYRSNDNQQRGDRDGYRGGRGRGGFRGRGGGGGRGNGRGSYGGGGGRGGQNQRGGGGPRGNRGGRGNFRGGNNRGGPRGGQRGGFQPRD